MMANILKILHPFIPFFFTETQFGQKINIKKFLKQHLISSSWPNYKNLINLKKIC